MVEYQLSDDYTKLVPFRVVAIEWTRCKMVQWKKNCVQIVACDDFQETSRLLGEDQFVHLKKKTFFSFNNSLIEDIYHKIHVPPFVHITSQFN